MSFGALSALSICSWFWQCSGELPEEQQASLVSDLARRRIAGLLDLLRRMKLVTASIGTLRSVKGQTRSELQDGALYAAEDTAWLQERPGMVRSSLCWLMSAIGSKKEFLQGIHAGHLHLCLCTCILTSRPTCMFVLSHRHAMRCIDLVNEGGAKAPPREGFTCKQST